MILAVEDDVLKKERGNRTVTGKSNLAAIEKGVSREGIASLGPRCKISVVVCVKVTMGSDR